MLRSSTDTARVSEARIVGEILVALSRLPWCVVWKNAVGTALHPDGRRVEYGVGGVGAPDLLCEVRTVAGPWLCVWLEVKSADGGLRPGQVRWHEAAGRMGRHVYVVRSADAAVAAVTEMRGGNRG